MDITSRIYVAGHRGLVGSAITRRLQAAGYARLITRTHRELDLEDAAAVERFFSEERPHFVFLAAAKVGGIYANSIYPVDFLLRNLKIQNNVIEAAWRHGVEGLLFLGSSCIYPRMAPQPLRESALLTGPLEATNQPYAIAKIAGIELCEAYHRQYGARFLSAMPTNLYGPNDNYDLENSHVLPALIRKFHLAKIAAAGDEGALCRDAARFGPIPEDFMQCLRAIARSRAPSRTPSPPNEVPTPAVRLWGTGSPRREFLYSDDLADACILLMERLDEWFSREPPGVPLEQRPRNLINIGCGEDLTIAELARITAETVGYDGPVEWDTGKPDGTPRKLLDVTRITGLGWKPRTPLREGIRLAYQDYLSRSVHD